MAEINAHFITAVKQGPPVATVDFWPQDSNKGSHITFINMLQKLNIFSKYKSKLFGILASSNVIVSVNSLLY